MRLLVDIFTEEEFLSDVFKYELAHNDVIIKAPSAYKSKDKVGDVDVGKFNINTWKGCGNAFGSGDDEVAGGDDGQPPEEKVIDIQFNFNLVEYPMSKSEFMTYIKGYLKKVKEHLTANRPERVDEFMKGAQEFIKLVSTKFDEYTIYTGAKESLDGGIALSFWEDETAPGPMFYLFKDGLKEVKL